MVLENRAKYSFLISLGFHLLVLWFFGYISVKDKHEVKFITDIDIIEPFIPSAPPGPKEEKPKNIWEFMKMALPTIKKPDMPGPKDEKPLDVVKKDIEKAIEVERKLVDKTAPLLKRTDALKFKEIGLKRADKIKDILTTADAGRKIDDGKIRDLTPSDLLTEKKAPLDKNSKADDLGIKLKTRVKDDGKIKEIVGTAEERKKVRELLAMEEKLVENTTRIASKGGGGGGGKPAIGYGGGGGINLKNEDLKKVETKVNIAPVKKAETAAALEKTAVSKSSVELIGPLQGRGIIVSYMPKYPEWMKEKGVEADIAVRFFVSPSGAVKDEMSIERTSGYPELDKIVMAVLKTWQFEALSRSAKQDDQWGVVTFRFKLAK